MTTHVIVGCGKQKRDHPTEARDLYTSTYFGAKRTYAEAVGDWWHILSAKHGIIPPDYVIDPYDVTVSDLTDDEWCDRVAARLPDDVVDRFARVDRVEVLAGRAYVDPIRDLLADRIDADVVYPFEDAGLGGIGAQMKWCRDRATEASNAGIGDYV